MSWNRGSVHMSKVVLTFYKNPKVRYFPVRSETRYLCVFVVDAALRELAKELSDVLGSDVVCKLQIVLPIFARFKLQKMNEENGARESANRKSVKKPRRLSVMASKEAQMTVSLAAAFHDICRALKKFRSLKKIQQQHSFSSQPYKDSVNKHLKVVAQTLTVCCSLVFKFVNDFVTCLISAQNAARSH